MTIRFIRWGVLLATAAILFGSRVSPMLSAGGRSSAEFDAGAILIAPFIKPGTVSYTPFNHFSLLKSLEDAFDIEEYLGYAGQPGLLGFFGAVTSDISTRH